jgi:hypothetical protein
VWRVAAGGGAEERALVDVEVEVESHLQQQAALDHAGRNLRGADRTEQDAVERPQFVECGVGEDLAVSQVALATEIELGGGDVDPCGTDDLHGRGRHLRADSVPADHCDVVRHGQRA